MCTLRLRRPLVLAIRYAVQLGVPRALSSEEEDTGHPRRNGTAVSRFVALFMRVLSLELTTPRHTARIGRRISSRRTGSAIIPPHYYTVRQKTSVKRSLYDVDTVNIVSVCL